MPLKRRSKAEDLQDLVTNEQQPATLDNGFDNEDEDIAVANAGGFIGDDYNERVHVNDINTSNFVPATLPYRDDDDYRHPAELQQQQDTQVQVLISDAPPDAYNFIRIVFYLLGIATMTPWNFFITAESYWMYKFRNTTLNDTSPNDEIDDTPLQKSFTCDLTLTASISGTTFLILHAIYGQHFTLRFKMLTTLSIILVIFIITTAFVEINTDRWQEQFFLITLFTVVIINISSASMSGAIFGIAGLFPSRYMTALVSGQALGGIFTALAFIGVLGYGAGPKPTAFIFFIIGSVLVFLSIVAFDAMSRRSFFRYYLEGGDKYKIVCATPSHSRSTVDEGVALESNLKEVFGKIYVDAVTICVLFATTLSVYPAVSVLMQSQNIGHGSKWSDIYYLPVVNYLIFNSGDCFGRILAGALERPRSNPHTVLLMSLLRTLFIPFFLCSNTNLHIFLPTLVHTDLAFIIMMITFAVSNGYLANIILIMAPRAVMQHEKEMASSIMAASLSCGLALGSILSMIFVELL